MKVQINIILNSLEDVVLYFQGYQLSLSRFKLFFFLMKEIQLLSSADEINGKYTFQAP